jgi:8-oxo-dGTP diphosphatase
MAEKGAYAYDYPRPMVTVDAVVLSMREGKRHVLLIRRGRPPFEGAWALPGGFVGIDEPLETAAERELAEETGLTGVALRQLHTFGDPGRDPRGRSISVVYWGEAPADAAVMGGDDAAEAGWFPLDALPPLAFDHAKVVEYLVEVG